MVSRRNGRREKGQDKKVGERGENKRESSRRRVQEEEDER